MTIDSLDHVPVCIAGIEAMVFNANQPPQAPLVFVVHGLGGSAVNCYEYCRDLAAMGLVVVTLDQRNHGRRLVDQRCNQAVGEDFAADLCAIIAGTAQDIALLIDVLPVRYELGCGPIGMVGFSLGGMATFAAMTIDPRIQVGVPLIASGDRVYQVEWMLGQQAADTTAPTKHACCDLEALIRKYNAFDHAERFADRPVLMLNGEADELVRIEGNRRFLEVARPHYSDPERLQLIGYPEMGHEVTDEMWDEARNWLKRWLLEQPESLPTAVAREGDL